MEFKSIASANWASGIFGTEREIRTLKILGLSQARIPIPPSPHIVVPEGFEPPVQESKSCVLPLHYRTICFARSPGVELSPEVLEASVLPLHHKRIHCLLLDFVREAGLTLSFLHCPV